MYVLLQVADLDDEFADTMLNDGNFDSLHVSAKEVSLFIFPYRHSNS